MLAVGKKLSNTEKEQLVAAACFMHLLREKTAGNFVSQNWLALSSSLPLCMLYIATRYFK